MNIPISTDEQTNTSVTIVLNVFIFIFVLRKSFNMLISSCGVYSPLLAQPYIRVLFVPHIVHGGVDNIC